MADAPKTPQRQTLSRRAKHIPSVNEEEPPPETSPASTAPKTPSAARKRAATKSESTPKSAAKAPKSVAAAKMPKRKPAELDAKEASVVEEAKETAKTPRKRGAAAAKQSSDAGIADVAEAVAVPARIGGLTPRKRTAAVPAAAPSPSLETAPAASTKKTPRKRATTAATARSPEASPPTKKTPRKRATTAVISPSLQAAPALTKKTPRKRATTAAVVAAEATEVAVPKTPARTPRKRATVAPTASVDEADAAPVPGRTPRKRATMAAVPVVAITPAVETSLPDEETADASEKQTTPPRFPVKLPQIASVAADEDEELAKPLPADSVGPSVGDADAEDATFKSPTAAEVMQPDDSELVPETPSPTVVAAALSSTFNEDAVADIDQSSVYDLASAESMVIDGIAANHEVEAEKPPVDTVTIDNEVEQMAAEEETDKAVVVSDAESVTVSSSVEDNVVEIADSGEQCVAEKQPEEAIVPSDVVKCATAITLVDDGAIGDAAEPMIEDEKSVKSQGNIESIDTPVVDAAAPSEDASDDVELNLQISEEEAAKSAGLIEPQAKTTESLQVSDEEPVTAPESKSADIVSTIDTAPTSEDTAPTAKTSADDDEFKLQVSDEEAPEPADVFLAPQAKATKPSEVEQTLQSPDTNEQPPPETPSIDLTEDSSFDSPSTAAAVADAASASAIPNIILIPDTPSGQGSRPLNETFSPEPNSPPRAVSTTRKGAAMAEPFGTPRCLAALKPLKGIRKRSFSVDVSVSKANKSVIFHSPSNQMLPIDAIDMQMEQSRREELQTSMAAAAAVGKENQRLRTPGVAGGRRKRSMSMCETGAVQKVRPVVGTPRRAAGDTEQTPKRTRIPDFRKIHERNFDRMESIADYKERTTGASGGGHRAKIVKPVNRAAGVAVPTAKTAAEIKARTMAAIKAELVQPVAFKPKPKDDGAPAFSAAAWKPPAMSSIPTFGGSSTSRTAAASASSASSSAAATAGNNSSKLADRQAKNRALINKGGHTAKAADVKERNTKILRGVRMNRRFELQMKFRNEHED